jgi:two-component system, OmpR family, sensor histidine kinase SenX3
MVSSHKTKKVAADAVAFLEVLDSAGVVLTHENEVLNQSNKAKQMALVEYNKLTNPELQTLVDESRRSKQPQTAEIWFARNLKSPKQFLVARATQLSEELMLLMVEDRTEAKRLEDVRRDFVENISHELKTPISAISLLADALQVAITNPEQVAKFASNLQKESKRLGTLVQRIIELSRIQAGDLSSEAQVFDLGNLIADAVEENVFLADSRSVKLSFDLTPGIKVLADAQLLTTAIRNLIENAILYSDANAQVGIGLKDEGDFAEITVIDNGIGIPIDQQERIFERFYRVDPSRSRDTGGTGLGLAIVKHAALNHGGEVSVFSRVGLGSTFTLRIPIYKEEI